MSSTPRNLYGVGFSPLSIKNKGFAFDEELVANKDIGLSAYFVNGSLVSAEYIARVKEHITQFTKKCLRDNTIGDIYRIILTDELVKMITDPGNIFDNTVSYGDTGSDNKINNMRFDIDFDAFSVDTVAPCDIRSSMIKIQFTLSVNENSKNYYLEESIEDISDKVFALDWSELDNDIEDKENAEYTLTLNTFEITPFTGFNSTTHRFAIYDVLIGLS